MKAFNWHSSSPVPLLLLKIVQKFAVSRSFSATIHFCSGGFRNGAPPPFRRVIRKFLILIMQRLWCNFLYSVPHFRFRCVRCGVSLFEDTFACTWRLHHQSAFWDASKVFLGFSFWGLCPQTPQRGLCPLHPRWGTTPDHLCGEGPLDPPLFCGWLESPRGNVALQTVIIDITRYSTFRVLFTELRCLLTAKQKSSCVYISVLC